MKSRYKNDSTFCLVEPMGTRVTYCETYGDVNCRGNCFYAKLQLRKEKNRIRMLEQQASQMFIGSLIGVIQ